MEKMAGNQSAKRRFPWRWIIIGFIVILLATGTGVGVRWLQTHNKHKNNTPTSAQNTAAESNNSMLFGDYNAAQQQIADALKKPNLSADDKFTLYTQQALNYENAGNNQAALDSYKKAAQNKQMQSLYESMAEVSVKLGDKTSAINYYKKAIQLILPSNPVGKSDKESLEKNITDLGGQP
jgi:tetratricopeptide (TPR) repeat protein